jgi:hypothetical protein
VARALAIRYVTVADGARAPYLARLAERRSSARACGYNCWAFERDGDPRRFVEFIEARDRAALDTALAQDALHAETLDWRHEPADADARAEIWLEIEAPPAPPIPPE